MEPWNLTVWGILGKLLLSALLAGLIGLERSRHGRAAGLRTHIIVSLGAAMSAMIGIFMVQAGWSTDPLRIAAQVISGIGFLGVGTILVRGNGHVIGLTTAAGLWATAAIGLACGFGFFVGALLCTAIFFVSILILTNVEKRGKNGKNICRLYLECSDAALLNPMLEHLEGCCPELYDIEVIPAKSAMPNHIGVEAVLPPHPGLDRREIVHEILGLENILFCVELP